MQRACSDNRPKWASSNGYACADDEWQREETFAGRPCQEGAEQEGAHNGDRPDQATPEKRGVGGSLAREERQRESLLCRHAQDGCLRCASRSTGLRLVFLRRRQELLHAYSE